MRAHEAELINTNPTDLRTWAATATPQEIDYRTSLVGMKLGYLRAERARAVEMMKRFESKPASREAYAADRAKADGLLQWYGSLAEVLEAEYVKRGRWNRYYLATATNGHVHRTTDCGTCNHNYRRTEFAWLTEYSAMDAGEFVAMAGERACTVCFPDAPVDRPSMLRTDVEAREQAEKAAAAKAEKAAAKAAKELTVKCANGERPKTVVSVERVAVAAHARNLHLAAKAEQAMRDGNRQYFEKLSGLARPEAETVAACVGALAGKLGEDEADVLARIMAKGLASYRRNY